MKSFLLLNSGLALAALLGSASARAASYALCIHEIPAQIAARTDPKAGPAYWGAFATFAEQLKAAGIMRGGSAFDTVTPVKTVKPRQPPAPAETLPPSTETFGGYFIIEVATETEALAWAARLPNPGGHVEVRALLPMMAK